MHIQMFLCLWGEQLTCPHPLKVQVFVSSWNTLNMFCYKNKTNQCLGSIKDTSIILSAPFRWIRTSFLISLNLHRTSVPLLSLLTKYLKRYLSFLDMNICLKRGIILTSIPHKTIDSHSYLNYYSSHNPSTKTVSHVHSSSDRWNDCLLHE